jgi:alginate O-acetyltransferase complex protein AlgI
LPNRITVIFNSIIFLFLFLPAFLALYFIAPRKTKNVVLILFSLFFYTWGDKILVLLLLTSVLLNFLGAKYIRHGSRFIGLIAMLSINIGLLCYFKYYNFGVDSINGLLGIFHLNDSFLKPAASLTIPLSYVVDVYNRKTEPSAAFLEFCAWFTMFPLLLAGPIVRYKEVEQQLAVKSIDVTRFTEGIARFITGLAKKVLIAGIFSSISNYIFSAEVSDISMVMAWTGILAFTFEIYFDFSGYSDMAIGLGKMIGFDFRENFNFPYSARDIRDFWRRWHISLSTWLRDYLFLPIAYLISRKLKHESYIKIKTDKIIYIIATTITFLVCGLWHGAAWTYVAWGFYFAIFLILEQLFLGRLLKKLWLPLRHVYTMLVVMCSFVIFRSESLSSAGTYLGKMFSFSAGDPALSSYIRFYYFNRESLLTLLAALIFSIPAYGYLRTIANTSCETKTFLHKLLDISAILVLGTLFIVSITYLASNTYNPFLYIRF